MSVMLAQHGPAKGQKINEGMTNDGLKGVIFSLNDESFDSIVSYIDSNSVFTRNNVFLDPQLYYSTYEVTLQKKLSDIANFPYEVTRSDWRKRDVKLISYIDDHLERTKRVSNTLITPGFHIGNIDWHFDYSIEIYNYCREVSEFDNFALSLLIDTIFFKSKKNVNEMLIEIDEMVSVKDHIYLTFCYENVKENNYEEIDSECLSNILHFVYKLRENGFKIIVGYSFLNSILFSMLDCEYIATGWFNTLRKFQRSRFDNSDTFGRRKKRYTSIPLLSYLMFDDINNIVQSNVIQKEQLCSGTRFDRVFIENQEQLSFVDLEHQYWESLYIVYEELSVVNNLKDKVAIVRSKISDSIKMYDSIIFSLEISEQKIAAQRIRSASKHLDSWLLAIDLFSETELLW